MTVPSARSDVTRGDCPDLLLVEDNPADVRLFREALDGDRTLAVAEDVAEARATIDRASEAPARRPRVVVVDMNLPDGTGDEVVSTLRSTPELELVPAIVLSTSAAPRDVTAAYRASANAYVPKPVDVAEFEDLVAAIDQFWLGGALLPE